MTRLTEHSFLSECVTATLRQFAEIGLFSWKDSRRLDFDFSGELGRGSARALVGQTLWDHGGGDAERVRAMLLEPHAAIRVCLARDTVWAHRLLQEASSDLRASGLPRLRGGLRVIWVPADFSAEDRAQRATVTDALTSDLAREIVVGVLLGRLGGEDIRQFVRIRGVAGLHFAILHGVKTASFDQRVSPSELALRLKVSEKTVRERLSRLISCGFVIPDRKGMARVRITDKGTAFLDVCMQLWREAAGARPEPHFSTILRLLDLRGAAESTTRPLVCHVASESLLNETPEVVTRRLLTTIDAAMARWGIEFAPHRAT